MTSKLKIFSRWFSLCAALGAGSACVSGPHFYLQYGNEYRELDLEKILADNPLAPGDNIKVANLGRSASASQHVVQIRDREFLHVHKIHDATVTMLRGQGYLVLDRQRINLKAGDVIHIPRGVAHQYVNTAGEPTVVLVVYAPPYDGKDTHPVNPESAAAN
ncbi:MAG TPA: cupin domain-containing protein [Candidatus Limnocylindrales bacterium]|nr:cupin domain-containing protein [Candidatus Limnocylindrales bacterium]